MNIPRHNLFADPAFTGEKHRGIGLRHTGCQGKQLLAGGIFGNDAFGVERGYGEAGNYLVRLFTDNADNKVKVLDPTMMKYAADQAAELDDTRRVKIFHDAQRYQASKMYYIPVVVGAGQTWVCSHKTVQNAGDFFTAANRRALVLDPAASARRAAVAWITRTPAGRAASSSTDNR